MGVKPAQVGGLQSERTWVVVEGGGQKEILHEDNMLNSDRQGVSGWV